MTFKTGESVEILHQTAKPAWVPATVAHPGPPLIVLYKGGAMEEVNAYTRVRRPTADDVPLMEATWPGVREFLETEIIQTMVERAGSFGVLDTYYHLNTFVNEWFTRDMVRATLRDMTDRGLCRYSAGLWTDSGEPAGSGYGLTAAGLERYDPEIRRNRHDRGGI